MVTVMIDPVSLPTGTAMPQVKCQDPGLCLNVVFGGPSIQMCPGKTLCQANGSYQSVGVTGLHWKQTSGHW